MAPPLGGVRKGIIGVLAEVISFTVLAQLDFRKINQLFGGGSLEIGNWEINYFPDLISSWKLKMQEMHCILLVFYIGATFFCAREAWEMLYFTCIYTTGGGAPK